MSTPNSLKIYCDGGARGNPGPAASAFVVINNENLVFYKQGFYLGKATNNQAEYCAVLKAFEWYVSTSQAGSLTFYLDSLLVASQLKGVYKIKDPSLKMYYSQIKHIIDTHQLQVLDYVHIPRALNARADFVVNQTLDNYA
jgi:ribonuclease HI